MVTQQISALTACSFPGCLSHPRDMNPWEQLGQGPRSPPRHQPGAAGWQPAAHWVPGHD